MEQNANQSSGTVRVPKDCLECRLVGGGGVLGSAIYVAYHGSKNPRPGGKTLSYIFALGKNICPES